MGRPPAYIFIVRHGNRLDAADQLWHLSSPTPYDPPLTYSGWTQSRAIGQRIAEILRENAPIEIPPTPPVDTSDASSLGTSFGLAPISAPGKKRRYKVVVHSSPFLRCVQTSVAVASGIATDPRPLLSPRPLGPLPPLNAPSRNSSMLSLHSFAQQHQPGGINKSVMRVDAFLGEWLSPGYFELITPPPSSYVMVAGAKAELVRREDYSNFVVVHQQPNHHAHSQSMGQLWGASRSNTWSADIAEDEELPKSGSQLISLPTLGDASRPSSNNLHSQGWLGQGPASGEPHRSNHGYVAPKPHFALSGKAHVPSGYVAHARDSCVNIDHHWDSMRAPHDWGDGGEFGEEWTAMHRRFRRGLQNLVDWYTTTDDPTEPVASQTVHFTVKPGSKPGDAEFAIDDDPPRHDDAADDDCIEESVVVLVSHAAGCNAMIGAITQQPVLMDVGLASLTVMARKPGKDEPPPRLWNVVDNDGVADADRTIKRHKTSASASSTVDKSSSPTVHTPGGLVPLNQYYEVKLLANTEHLRSNVSSPTSAGPWSGSGAMSSVFGGAGGGTRGRHANSLSSALGNLVFNDSAMNHRSASAGSSFHGSGAINDHQIEAAVRRASGATQRPPPVTLAVGKRGSATVGSGVTTFSPPSSTASPLGRARTTSIGLWSPVSAPADEIDKDEDDDADDDMEIRLSFRSSEDKSTKAKAANKTISNASTASSRSSSLSGMRNSNANRKSNLSSSTTTSGTTTTSLYRTESATSTTTYTTSANGRDILFTAEEVESSSTVTATTTTRNSGLWQVAAESKDGRLSDLGTSKRRWALNEPSAQL